MSQQNGGIIAEVKSKAQAAEGSVTSSVNQVKVPMTDRMGLFSFLKELSQRMGQHHLGAFAGNLTYSGIFAIFPFLLFVLSLLSLFHASTLLNHLISQAAPALPTDAVTLLRSISKTITKNNATGAVTISAIVSIVLALWGTSGAFRAVMEAMNVMYGVNDTRPAWKRYVISIVMSAVVAVLLIAALVLVVAGPMISSKLASVFGLGQVFTITWDILQWPLLLGFVLLAFALIYYEAPDVTQKFKFISPGAVGAVILWLVFSLLFSLYVNHFGSYNKTYGALASIVIFMLYINYSAQIVLLGALSNRIIEEHAPDSKAGHVGNARTGGTDTDAQAPRTVRILQESKADS